MQEVLQGQHKNGRIVSVIHEDTPVLRRMAVFDVLVKNADRKGDHVLTMTDGHRYWVDHGLSAEELAGIDRVPEEPENELR